MEPSLSRDGDPLNLRWVRSGSAGFNGAVPQQGRRLDRSNDLRVRSVASMEPSLSRDGDARVDATTRACEAASMEPSLSRDGDLSGGRPSTVKRQCFNGAVPQQGRRLPRNARFGPGTF